MGEAGKVLGKRTTLGPGSRWTHSGYKVLKRGPPYQAHPQTPGDSKRAGSSNRCEGVLQDSSYQEEKPLQPPGAQENQRRQGPRRGLETRLLASEGVCGPEQPQRRDADTQSPGQRGCEHSAAHRPGSELMGGVAVWASYLTSSLDSSPVKRGARRILLCGTVTSEFRSQAQNGLPGGPIGKKDLIQLPAWL